MTQRLMTSFLIQKRLGIKMIARSDRILNIAVQELTIRAGSSSRDYVKAAQIRDRNFKRES
jgi:hypothetical protein